MFCKKYGTDMLSAPPAAEGAPMALPLEGAAQVKAEPGGSDGESGAADLAAAAAAAEDTAEDAKTTPLIARGVSAVAGAAASAATLPGPGSTGLTHRLGTGGAPGSGLTGEALKEEFRKVLKGTLSWRPETAQVRENKTHSGPRAAASFPAVLGTFGRISRRPRGVYVRSGLFATLFGPFAGLLLHRLVVFVVVFGWSS